MTAAACELCALLADPAQAGGAVIWRDARLAVLLVDEPHYPGFCRVLWHEHVKEMSDLAPAERQSIMEAVWQVEAAQRAVLGPEKINLASFGNMTPHVHWHVIPRYRDDVHFPQPTWAVAQRAPDPAGLEARRALLPRLRAAIIERLDA
ncbi:MAG: HIT family protein [Pseudomonadota bacterium]